MNNIKNKTSDKVNVAVRVRPSNKKENSRNIVKINQNCITLTHPNDIIDFKSVNAKQFGFDYCFPSTSQQNKFNSSSSNTANSSYNSSINSSTQEHIFQTIGIDVINNTFSGFNTCIFAYGQTGSGKSYTMMGTKEEIGLIPRLSKELFQRIKSHQDSKNIKVEISFYEVYNERIRDLLSNSKQLKVREHSLHGPMVEGLSIFTVVNFEQIERYISIGNNLRSTAATLINEQSSRSHSVFSIKMTQIIVAEDDKNLIGEKISKISLVDLAGSERIQKTGAIGKRLEEGSNINKSLTALGKVIAALASNKGTNTTKNNYFVPYRDSVLTWLLKENLGGNSRTTMIATISPSSEHYEETLSTLRFADRAKRIKTNAVINEDPNAKIIRELYEEVERLKQINLNTKIQQKEDLKEAMAQIAEKHVKEKQLALEQQYQQFSEYIHLLKQNNNNLQRSPHSLLAKSPSSFEFGSTPFSSDFNHNKYNYKNKFLEWASKREQLFTLRLEKLKQLIYQANKLCFDANKKSQMLAKLNNKNNCLFYFVNLHIPLTNLRPLALNLDYFKSFQLNNEEKEEEKEINCICEPIILANWGNNDQINNNNFNFSTQINNNNGYLQQFNIEEIKLKVEEMNEAISSISSNKIDKLNNFEEFVEYSNGHSSFIREKHNLVGVANIYLGSLLYNLNSPIQLPVLIINQQGEISGKLYVQIHRTALLNNCEYSSEEEEEENNNNEILEEKEDSDEQLLGQTFIFKIEIIKATNLPLDQSNLVFCQYSFFDQQQIIIPSISNDQNNIYFNSENYFELIFTQTFLNYIKEDSLSIEVWGHKLKLNDNNNEEKEKNNLNILMEQKIKILKERWKEVTKRLDLFIEILELNNIGEYIPVTVENIKEEEKQSCSSGGIYKLRSGQQRRLRISISSIFEEEKEDLNLPLYFEDINLISIGSPIIIKEKEKQFDSYNENDLIKIQNNWNNLIKKRREYLKNKIINLSKKEEENNLFLLWIELIEERNVFLLEGIPGNNNKLEKEEFYEKYCPIIFLDNNKENNNINLEEQLFEENNNLLIFGENCLLLDENENNYLNLNILEKEINQSNICCICPWDSSLHECSQMNKISKNGEEYIYIIVKILIKIKQPINACLILRKRLCLQFISSSSSQNLINNNTSLWPSLFFNSWQNVKIEEEENNKKRRGTGLFIDIIGCIPKCSFDLEKRETLAKLSVLNNNNLSELLLNEEEEEKDFEKSSKYLNEYLLKEYLSKTIKNVEWIIKMDRLRQEELINYALNKSCKKINKNNLLLSNNNMKRTISLPNKISNFLSPNSTTNYSNKITPIILNNNINDEKQKIIKNNNFNNLLLPKSQSHNNGFTLNNITTIDNSSFINSPNSSGYASLTNSTVGQCTQRLTGIEEEENQLNISPNDVSPCLTTNNYKKEEKNINFNCCENKLFSPSSSPFSFIKNNNFIKLPPIQINNLNKEKNNCWQLNKGKQKIDRKDTFLFN